MARLESQSKLGFYPSPEGIPEMIASWFSAPDPYRLADPCCADGWAVNQFKGTLGQDAETWGIELSPGRAKQARSVLDVVLPTDFYTVRWEARSTSFIYNNPPYDYSFRLDHETNKRIRHEHLFPTWCSHYLTSGGHQVIIIPRDMLADEKLVRHLAGSYDKIMIRRLPDGQYEIFKQIVIFAIGKHKYANPKKEKIEAISALWDADDVSILPITSGNGEFVIPPAPAGDYTFTFVPVKNETLIAVAQKLDPAQSQDLDRSLYVRPSGSAIFPAIPEKTGHIAMEISSGDVGTLTLDDGNMLAKGTIRKTIVETRDEAQSEDGSTSTKVTQKERLLTHIATVTKDGATNLLNDLQSVADFMRKYASELADVLKIRNVPTYNFEPTENEWSIVSKVAKGLPPLPGRTERGMFEMQKHVAISVYRTLMKHNQGLINAEMGFGKTVVAIGIAMLLNKWPAIVVVPGHMIYKWQRTFHAACDPTDPIVARVITRPVRGTDSWLNSKVIPLIEAAGGDLVSYERIQVPPISKNDEGGRIKLVIECHEMAIKAVVKTVKRGLVQRYRGAESITPQISLSYGGVEVIVANRDQYSMADFYEDYTAGLLGKKAVAVIGHEPFKYGPGDDFKARGYKMVNRRWWDNKKNKYVFFERPQCPKCGHVYEPGVKRPRFCTHIVEKHVLDDQSKIIETQEIKCGQPLFQMSRWSREGLARLLQRKYRHFFKLYIADEIHKAKSIDTDIGTADGRMMTAVKYGVALTGTVFGGVSSSIFALLYRRNREVREQYDHDDRNLWVDHYGLWERTWHEKKGFVHGYGRSTGQKRIGYRSKELPGISPAVIRYMLPITVFGKITDLGYTLPPFIEKVEALDMDDEQGKQYEATNKSLLSQAISLSKTKAGSGAISTWFTTVRYRPSSGFRDETAKFRSLIKHFMPAITTVDQPWLPKERKLAEIVAENKRVGRKTLVFVEQTGTRDIRSHVADAVRTLVPGVAVETLSAQDMDPAKRERWIELNAPKMDVLIVNPRLVETGLDLVMFTDLVFFELPVSLYTLWQAMRRVWRLGQDKKVFCTFLIYNGTVETKLFKRMGKKLKSAMVLYGDEASGAMIEEDDTDFEREMFRKALKGKTYDSLAELNEEDQGSMTMFVESVTEPDDLEEGLLSNLFDQDNDITEVQITESPMGNPIAKSPVLVTVTERREGPTLQLSMFGDAIPASKVKVRRRK
jgi:hypothetical protein